MTNPKHRRNRRSSFSPSNSAPQTFARRLLQSEQLESRVLLAADMVDAWQNTANCNDVDQSGLVTSFDALAVIDSINTFGARQLGEMPAGEPGATGTTMLVDTNGDGYLTSADALQIFEELNAHGENELVQIRLEATDMDGNPISTITEGSQFQLRGLVKDLQDEMDAQGVFAAYLDVTYDSTLVSVTEDDIVFGSNYRNGLSGNLSVAGEIDEIGGFAGTTPVGPEEQLLFAITLNADLAGTLDFTSNPADNLPSHEVLLFGSNTSVAEVDIDYGSASLAILSDSNAPPRIEQIVPNDTVEVEIESPRQLPINGVDALGGGLTYTVSVDDGNLVEAEFTTGNRSWSLEVGDFGTMVFEFFEDKASRATSRFIELTESGFFDNIIFHRVIDGFVIQGGDPLGNGTGGSDLGDFDDQFHVDLQHNQAGILSMAKSTDDTNNSQFFVTDAATPWLDFNHTVFGQMVEGFDVLEAISSVQTGARDMPVDDVVITSATVIQDNENAILSVRALTDTGSTNVTVTATDAEGKSVNETFEVTLAGSSDNSPPFLDDIPEFTANAGSTFEFQLGYTDIEDDAVNFRVSVADASGATATVSDAGLVSVEIPNDASGSQVLLDVLVRDQASDEQRVVINVVTEVSGTVADDSFTIDEDTSTTFDVLNNDELDSAAVIIGITNTDNLPGTAVISSDGRSIVFTPAADFFGNVAFTYQVSSADTTLEGDVSVNVLSVVDGPNAVDDFFPQDLDTDDPDRELYFEDPATAIPLRSLFLNDLNGDGEDQQVMTITAVSEPQFGSVTFDAFGVMYTPAADFFGIDTFTYTTTDPLGMSSTATVAMDIAEWNDAPVVEGESLDAEANATTVFSAADILANDSPGPANESDQTLRLLQVIYEGDGTVVLNEEGDVVYTPAAGFTGQETIAYSAEDNGTTNGNPSARASIGVLTVNVLAQFANDDIFFLGRTQTATTLDVLANDDQNLEIVSVTQPSGATVTIVDEMLEYTNDTATGNVSFNYTVRDADGNESTATVAITLVEQVAAVDDTFIVSEVTLLDVLANDVSPANVISISIQSVTQPATGLVSIVDGEVEYTPLGNDGTESFTYVVVDSNGFTSSASVEVTFEANTNEPPSAFNDDVEVTADGGEQALDVLANDTSLPDLGEQIFIQEVVVSPQNGTSRVSADKELILYTPNAGFEGTDTLVYRISDGNGGLDTAEVDITVAPKVVVAELIALDDEFTVVAAGQQTYDVLSNDEPSGDGNSLTITSVDSSNANGTASISSDGTRIIYVPAVSAPGIDTLTYTIADGTGATAQATVSITVPDLKSQSTYAGEIFNDLDQDGIRDDNENGLGGVTVVLSGTDHNGNAVREETKTSLDGDFVFVGIVPGEYTVSEMQPAFTRDGQNTHGFTLTESDDRDITVTEQLISSSGNSYAERGMFGRFALIDALSSQREPGLFVVMDGDDLAWVEERGGWSDVGSIGIVMDGDSLMLSSSDVGTGTLSMSDRSQVKLIGQTGRFTVLRINGTSDQLLSAAAVDQLFAG